MEGARVATNFSGRPPPTTDRTAHERRVLSAPTVTSPSFRSNVPEAMRNQRGTINATDLGPQIA